MTIDHAPRKPSPHLSCRPPPVRDLGTSNLGSATTRRFNRGAIDVRPDVPRPVAGDPLARGAGSPEHVSDNDPVTPPDTAAGPPAETATRSRLPHLAAAQTLSGVGVAGGIAVGALLAEQVTGSASMAGLAQTASVLGGALLAVPLATLAEHRGRALALSTGYALASVGAVVIMLGAVGDSFATILAGLMLFGGGTATGLQARYAAIDGVAGPRRGRILSIVVWSSTIGAVLGPNLAGLGGDAGDAVGIPRLAGPFLFSLVAFVLAGAIVLFLPGGRTPLTHHEAPTTTARALRAVRASPSALAGMSAVAGSHAVMVAVMVMSPVHLGRGGATLQIVGLVISLHIAGMYALSPVMGALADRWGPRRTIGLGVAILLASLITSATAPPDESTQVGVALVLLGLGWSACLVAGSALLTASVPSEIRTKVQGTGDLVMGLAAAAAGVCSGPVMEAAGYSWLSIAAIALLVPIVVLIVRARPVDPLVAEA